MQFRKDSYVANRGRCAMENRLVYSPVGMLLMLLFAFLLSAVVGVLFLDLARTGLHQDRLLLGQALFCVTRISSL